MKYLLIRIKCKILKLQNCCKDLKYKFVITLTTCQMKINMVTAEVIFFM